MRRLVFVVGIMALIASLFVGVSDTSGGQTREAQVTIGAVANSPLV
jgi:hypothetical protein